MDKISAGHYVRSSGYGGEKYYAVKTEAGYWSVGIGSNHLEDFKYYREAKEFILSRV
jgi:hypothetical protein